MLGSQGAALPDPKSDKSPVSVVPAGPETPILKHPPAVLTAEELGALLDNEQLLREVGHAAGLADLAGNSAMKVDSLLSGIVVRCRAADEAAMCDATRPLYAPAAIRAVTPAATQAGGPGRPVEVGSRWILTVVPAGHATSVNVPLRFVSNSPGTVPAHRRSNPRTSRTRRPRRMGRLLECMPAPHPAG